MWKPASTRSASTINPPPSPAPLPFPGDDFVNRQVSMRFSGQSLRLSLSLGLFSSAGVDPGSMLLLKTIAAECDLDSLRFIFDAGCGAGTLGLALAARCPQAQVHMADRDALAAAFSQHNAALNSIPRIQAASRLFFEAPHSTPYDLILSNFPAKAGNPVLADYLHSTLAHLAEGGRAVVVIVNPLADHCRELILRCGAEILLESHFAQHTVFHYRRTASAMSYNLADGLAPYIRHEGEFILRKTPYRLETAWNIGDFDTLSWRLKLIGDVLTDFAFSGSALFWSPGQGHLPVAAMAQGARYDGIILAGRDRLALRLSRRNLESSGYENPISTVSLADPGQLDQALEADSLDMLLTDISPVPKSNWVPPLKTAASMLLRPRGRWVLLGRSSDLARLGKSLRGWTSLNDRRSHAWRVLVLQRNARSPRRQGI